MTHSTRHHTPYERVRKELTQHAVRQSEVPTEFAISLPLPTRRWSLPAYACFAGPAARTPHRPLRLARPDRWWAVHASSHALVAYGLVSAVPFADTLEPEELVVNRSGRSVTELDEDLRVLGELMDATAPAFLDGADADRSARRDLLEALTAAATPAVLPWYRALTPDFFAWLEG